MTPPVLVCPGCRSYASDGGPDGGPRIDLQTLEPAGDALACACGRRYPVIDGVPIVLAPEHYPDATTLVERDLPVGTQALLAQAGPDDAPYARLLEHLAIYLDAHWGDRATPPPDGPGAGLAVAAVLARIAARAAHRVDAAVELGCSTGRIVAALAAGADHVVGLDLHAASLRRARRLLAGEALTYARRLAGRHYAPATAAGLATPNVTLACADALDPPLVPGTFGRVVALNLLDAVRSPRQLLAVVDGLCRRGGEVILASPYAWQSSVLDDAERLGAADPAAAVRGWLADRGYVVEDEAELPWTLRRDARSAVAYCIHYVRARKP